MIATQNQEYNIKQEYNIIKGGFND